MQLVVNLKFALKYTKYTKEKRWLLNVSVIKRNLRIRSMRKLCLKIPCLRWRCWRSLTRCNLKRRLSIYMAKNLSLSRGSILSSRCRHCWNIHSVNIRSLSPKIHSLRDIVSDDKVYKDVANKKDLKQLYSKIHWRS